MLRVRDLRVLISPLSYQQILKVNFSVLGNHSKTGTFDLRILLNARDSIGHIYHYSQTIDVWITYHANKYANRINVHV